METLNPDRGIGRQSPRGDASTVAEGMTIYLTGDEAAYWFEVKQGIVRTCRFLADGHRQLTGFFHPGELFGLDEEYYTETAEAVTRVVLRRHRRTRCKGSGHLALDVDDPAHRALGFARRSLFLFGHKTALARVAAFLVQMAELAEADGEVELAMSRADIADHLGLTIHTVSRTIAELHRKGLIRLDGPRSIRVPDQDALMRAAGDAPVPAMIHA